LAFIIDPSSLSFSKILADLQTYIAGRPDATKWNSFYQSGVGQTQSEMIAALGAFLSYHAIVSRRENYLQYAENQSSAIGISETLGYSTFKGRNTHLNLTVIPSVTQVLPRFSVVGAVKDQDLVILQDTPVTAGVPITFEVVIGDLTSESIAVGSNSLATFRFETPNVTEDYRVLLNSVEVEFSNRILDLDNDKFSVITNPLNSVDVIYLNRATAPVQYNTGDILSLQFIYKKNLNFTSTDLNFFFGDIDSYTIQSSYQDPETIKEIRINAPLFHETQALVRGRLDFLKIFKIIDPSFVSTSQRDVTAAIIELCYLKEDFLALTNAEKTALLETIKKQLVMGVPPPLITDPVRAILALEIDILKQNNSENTLALVQDIVAAEENILNHQVSLEDLESSIEALSSVKIARVSIKSDTWTASTKFQRGQHVKPTTENGFIYEMAKILYYSGSSQPVWPLVNAETVIDNDLVWRAEPINLADLTITTWLSNTSYVNNQVVVPPVPTGKQYRLVDFINKSFGSIEIQGVGFDVVPDDGTWRLHYDDGNHGPQQTTDLPYNATALDVQNALNATNCLSGVIVTGNYSTGFTITFAGDDANKQQPLLTSDDPGLDEQQLISFDQVPNSGSFGLDFDGDITSSIPFTATAPTIKAALEALPSINLVDVSGDFTNGFTVTFKGNNAKKPVVQLVQALLASPGVDEVQTIGFASVPTSGFWRLHLGSEFTLDLPYNANATSVQTALNALNALSNMSVSGNYSIGFTVTFAGADGKKPQALLSVSNAGRNEKQKILFSIAPDFGTWRIDYNGDKTSYLLHNASNTDVQTALNALTSLSGVVVSGDYSSGFAVEFAGADGLKEHNLVAISDPGVNEVQRITFPTVPDQGNFAIQFDSFTTSLIPYNATASIVKAALEGLSNLDLVAVTGDFTSGFTVEFQGNKASTDVPAMTVVSNTLDDNQVAEITDISCVSNVGNVLDGKVFWLYDDFGSVAFWIDSDNNGTPEPVQSLLADRSVRIGTILTGDSADDVAIKVKNAIDGDAKFSATVATNIVTATSTTLGARTDANAQTSGFSMTVVTAGVTVGVIPVVTTLTPGETADNRLTKISQPITITVEREQLGLIPANSLLNGITPVAVSIVEATAGALPVSNLERSSVPVDVVITTPIEGQYPANNLSNLGGPVVISHTTLVDASDAEPTWPTEVSLRVIDGDVIWQSLLLNGTPDTWEPATNYKIGDFVAPTAAVLDTVSGDPLMFQCVGFVGQSAGSQPVFPVVSGNSVIDNNIEWTTRLATQSPNQLAFKEYYDVVQTVILRDS